MREKGDDVKWISVAEAARILGVSRRTAYRSLENPDIRAARWGDEGVGWRQRPLSAKANSYQVSLAVVRHLSTPQSS